MSKIIKVSKCWSCPYIRHLFSYRHCHKLLMIKQSLQGQIVDPEEFKIIDHSKTNPNCPLEDYPENNKKRERK